MINKYWDNKAISADAKSARNSRVLHFNGMRIIILTILIFQLLCAIVLGDSQELYILIHKIDPVTLVKDYLVENNEIKVVYGVSEIAEIKYARKLKPDEIVSLTKFLDESLLSELRESYINPEVEDGYQIIYTIQVKGKKFTIRTFNAYQPTMISISKKMNSLLPKNHQIRVPSISDIGIILME